MKNTFGQSLIVTLFGESHGSAVGVVLDGLTPGLPVCEEEIARQLSRRRPASPLDTARREEDHFEILSGVFEGHTTGTPLCIVIPNTSARSADYDRGVARPSHADYAAFVKYHGYEDYRGGGHFSGRITAALCAAGGILIPALRRKGIEIGTHILRCAGVQDRPFENELADIACLDQASFPTLDRACGEEMISRILQAREENDSVGGITQTAICGLPAGLGEPWFDSAEGLLSHALFSIGGIKGVSFGEGFGFADLAGSEANDAFRMRDGQVTTTTNRSGGINGGITNGMPVVFQCAVRPTPSISKPQRTVDFVRGEDRELVVRGRHDPAILRRICPVIDSVSALAAADMLCQRFGTDCLAEEASRRLALCGKRNLVLIGMPTCGKTTVGSILARLSGRTLLDMDEVFADRMGTAPGDFIRQKGEALFRMEEGKICAEASRTNGRIIATGGGTVLDPENVRRLRENGVLIFLDRALENLRATKSHPLSSDEEKLARLYRERLNVYRGAADFVVDANRPAQQVAEELRKEFLT